MSTRKLKAFLVPAIYLFSVGAAQAVKVAATVPQMRPAPAMELLDRFHDAVVKGLSKGGDVLPAAEVRSRLAADPGAAACVGDKCVKGVAGLLKVDRVVSTTIDADGKTYTIKVAVFDAEGEKLGATVEELCDICTMREANEAIERAAEKAAPLLAQAAAVAVKPAPKPIEKVEPAPKVVIVEKPVPVAVVDEDEPKPHEAVAMVEPKHDEPAPSVETHRPVDEGQPAAAKTEPAREANEGGFPYRPVAFAAFGVAAAALIATISFGYFAGKENAPTCGLADPTHACPEIYKGNVGPAVGFGVGTAAAAALGAVFMVLDHNHRTPPAQVAVVPTKDGIAASASFAF